VVDLYDTRWPVIRHIEPSLADRGGWYLAETRAFFAIRAATWDAKFGDDMPAYAAAVGQTDIPIGGTVIDVGCGTGRALPALRKAVGPSGTVIGVDITEQMLSTAWTHGRTQQAHLILADARHLPLSGATVDAVFAAGLIGHIPEVEPALTELARVTVDGGRLALFHPSGRAALAARRGRQLRPDEPLAEDPLRRAMSGCGWRLDVFDDAPHRFFARATRKSRHID
jgi:SAM-dependent methyltransferase